MNNLDRMKLLKLAVQDMSDAVHVYEKAKADYGYIYAGANVPKYCSKESIKRRITQIRQDLLVLEKGL